MLISDQSDQYPISDQDSPNICLVCFCANSAVTCCWQVESTFVTTVVGTEVESVHAACSVGLLITVKQRQENIYSFSKMTTMGFIAVQYFGITTDTKLASKIKHNFFS